jgi:CRP-like cAMP-binding protein
MPSTVELLARVPLFSGLESEDLARLAEASRVQTFPPATSIVEMGEPGRSLYLVTEGEVAVLYPSRETEFELARLGPGEFFGEMALLNDKPRSTTVRSLGEVSAIVLDKTEFRAIVLERPLVALELIEALSVRIRQADEQISGLSDQAVRDALTGLMNRRAFSERLGQEVDRSRRYEGEFSLILLDLDHFKSVNDALGTTWAMRFSVGSGGFSWSTRAARTSPFASEAKNSRSSVLPPTRSPRMPWHSDWWISSEKHGPRCGTICA